MILEGLVTTVSAAGALNIAPMGPRFNPNKSDFELRPFATSTTYLNLVENPCGVFHVTDDVELIARAAINQFDEPVETRAATSVNGRILADCCRWYEFEAIAGSSDSARKEFHCRILSSGRTRDFYGFNRGKHAVLEATIAVTRIGILPPEEIEKQIEWAKTMVAKTGGTQEQVSLSLLIQYLVHIEKAQPECDPGHNF